MFTLGPVDPDAAEPVSAIPDPALVVLIGPSGSGKSTWAARYRAAEVVSADQLRGMVGSGSAIWMPPPRRSRCSTR